MAVVILNWNGKNDTVACLTSLPFNVMTVVVDNGSTDDSVVTIKAQFPHVDIVETGANLGYAGGNNVGIQHALKKGADLVLLLNNDTVVEPNFTTALLDAADKLPHVALFGAYPLQYKQPHRLDHLGGVWDGMKGVFKLVGAGENDGFQTDEPLDYICGCSIMIRREVFATIGFLEADFFLFWEEADFCMRARRAGYSLHVVPQARLLHKVSASFVGGSPHKTYFWWRGRWLWIERNCSKEEKERLFKTVLKPAYRHLRKLYWIKSAELLLLRLLGQRSLARKENKRREYRAALEAYRDYQERKFGPGPSW